MSRFSSLPYIYYKNRSNWSLTPNWCRLFLEIGAFIAKQPIKPYRSVIGCAIPTKAYAAVFAAIGVVSQLARLNRFTLTDSMAYIEKLRSLKLGDPLIYRRHNKYTKGIFDGWRNDNNQWYLRIKTSHSQNIYVPQNLLLGVEPLLEESFKIPRTETTRTLTTQKELEFLLVFFNDKNLINEFIAHSRLDCLIIGSKIQIHREVCENQFAFQAPNGEFTEGSLNMLLRIRELLTDSSAYHTRLWGFSNSSEEQRIAIDPPAVVIFNGATSFLRWRDSWRTSHWIVLLDRTEPHFDEAVQTCNQEYISNRAENLLLEPLPAPRGLEFIAYQEGNL